MNIRHEEIRKKGKFYVEENGQEIAELRYYHSDAGKINIYHTEVDESFRGKGVGSSMVEKAVQYARENGLMIDPTCPYAKRVMERTAEYHDVLAA